MGFIVNKLGYCGGCGKSMRVVKNWYPVDYDEKTGKVLRSVRHIRCVTLEHIRNRFIDYWLMEHDTKRESKRH